MVNKMKKQKITIVVLQILIMILFISAHFLTVMCYYISSKALFFGIEVGLGSLTDLCIFTAVAFGITIIILLIKN